MDGEIRERLLDLNPWFGDPNLFARELQYRLPETFVARGVDQTGFDQTRQAKLVVGPRQAGKSTLIWSSLQGQDPNQILFLNGEERLVRSWVDSAARILRDLQEEFPAVRTLFFDEMQHIEDAGLIIKGLVDSGRKFNILVTGSSSFHLQDQTRESLAGRAERRLLLPFSLGELLAHEPTTVPAVAKQRARDIVLQMLMRGSYPAVWFAQDPQRELRKLIEAFVLRDASDRFQVRRPDAFRQLMQLAAGQVGQMANFSEWAAQLGISASTVRQYLNLMEETWILRLLPAFAGGKRREITSAVRVHFYDPGLRNALLGRQESDPLRHPDLGALVEGLAFAELSKTLPRDWSLRYWRAKGGAEVDFVLSHGRRTLGIEIKSGRRANLSRSARSFIEAYTPENFLLVSLNSSDDPRQEKINASQVQRIDLTDLATTVNKIIGKA